MITLLNMIFANPLAYLVFPNMVNTYNTGTMEKAVYTGHIVITDSSGNTHNFTNTNTIDFSNISGIVTIDNITDKGSVLLGRWDTSLYSPWIFLYFDYPLILNSLPANGYSSGINNTNISIGAHYVDRTTIGQATQSGSSIPWYCFEDFSGDYGWFTISNVGTRTSYGEGRCYFDIEVEPNTTDETRSYDIPVKWSWTRSEDDPDTFFEGIDSVSGSGTITITQEGGAARDIWRFRIEIDDRFKSMPAEGITTQSSDNWWVSVVAVNEFQNKRIYLPTSGYSVEAIQGAFDLTFDRAVTSTYLGHSVYNVCFTLAANTDTEPKSGLLRVRLRMSANEILELLQDPNIMGVMGSVSAEITQEATPWIAPYTPGWSIGFSMTNQGLAARKIINGIEVLLTGSDPDHDDNNFFGYTDNLYEGERFYSATIQVSGLPEGYSIIGIHGWDGVVIDQDGEYTLPEFTWTNPSDYPNGTSIPYQDVPSLRFVDGTLADVMFDTPITIVITSVLSIEESVNSHMVLWYDIAKLGATNENMTENPVLVDHSGNGHDATCYNFAWTEESGINTTNYPNALVSDGVDDYCLVEGLPLLSKVDGYTVIAKRKIINLNKSALASRRTASGNENSAFQFEREIDDNKFGVLSYAALSYVELWKDDVTFQTIQSYNGTPIEEGLSTADNPILLLYGFSSSISVYAQCAIYSFLLFNRDLTAEEIEWVKTNLIETEQ